MTTGDRTLKLAAVGQALIRRDVLAGASASPQTQALIERLRAADCAFTNLEGAILGRHGGWPMKAKSVSPIAPAMLDTLRGMGFGLLALANNHAGDLGPPGILSTLDETTARGFTVAGAGPDAGSASRAGTGLFGGRRIALVAVDSGPWGEHAYAADTRGDLPARPGVNRLKVDRRIGIPSPLYDGLKRALEETGHAQRVWTRVSVGFQQPAPEGCIDVYGTAVAKDKIVREVWTPDEADLARIEAEITRASADTDLVIAYLHNHHWPADWKHPPAWMRQVARRWLSAGADVFLSHGAPVLQGMELFDGKLAAYGLGNFIFHSSNQKVRAYPDVWRSALLSLTFENRRLARVEASPVSLGDPALHGDPAGDRDAPRLWSGPDATAFLEDWLDRSAIPREHWTVTEECAVLTLA